MTNIQGERLARVEEQVNELKDKVDKIDKKLDALLALRNKGAGILWLLSAAGVVVVEFLHKFWR
jgi:hypothetical protein